MKKLIGAVFFAGLIFVIPATAGGSSLQIAGGCVVTKDGRVGLHGSVFSYEYDSYKPVRWVYRARRVDGTRWFHPGGYLQTLDVDPELIPNPALSDAGNFTGEFDTEGMDAEGLVFRLDLIVGEEFERRYPRVAFYNDANMDPEDCRQV